MYYKPRMPLNDWANYFKYVINVEGNCGSARLAKQLFDDAAVFFVAGEDEEWFAACFSALLPNPLAYAVLLIGLGEREMPVSILNLQAS